MLEDVCAKFQHPAPWRYLGNNQNIKKLSKGSKLLQRDEKCLEATLKTVYTVRGEPLVIHRFAETNKQVHQS